MWHAEHQKACPHAETIDKEVLEKCGSLFSLPLSTVAWVAPLQNEIAPKSLKSKTKLGQQFTSGVVSKRVSAESLQKFCFKLCRNLQKICSIAPGKGTEILQRSLRKFRRILRKFLCNDPFPNNPISELLTWYEKCPEHPRKSLSLVQLPPVQFQHFARPVSVRDRKAHKLFQHELLAPPPKSPILGPLKKVDVPHFLGKNAKRGPT